MVEVNKGLFFSCEVGEEGAISVVSQDNNDVTGSNEESQRIEEVFKLEELHDSFGPTSVSGLVEQLEDVHPLEVAYPDESHA